MPFLADTRPLRVSRDFRRLWIGQAVSLLGSMITTAALPYQVFHLTHSSLDVGLLGLAQLGPLVGFGLAGGALADRVDKRRLLLVVVLVSLTCSSLLAVNASLSHPQVWVVFVVGALASGTYAVSFPVLRSLLPMLVEEELRPAAFSLQAVYGTFGMMVGPAVAGVLIGGVGLGFAYLVDVVTFVVGFGVFAGIAPSPPLHAPGERPTVLEGLRYLRGHSVVMSIFGIDFLAMVFGMPRALFPALAVRLHGGPQLYGLLLSSVAAGAFVASLLSGWTSRIDRQGRALVIAVSGWGAAIAVAGLTRHAVVVLAAFAVAADMISGVFRSTIAADVTPDHLRGRVSGVELAVYAGGPVLGDVEAGVVGGLLGLPFAIVSGGVACIATAAAFALGVPGLAGHRRQAAQAKAAPLNA